MKTFTSRQYAKILYHVTVGKQDRELAYAVEKFFDFLRQERALSRAPAILDAFLAYAKGQEGIVEVAVTSAREMKEKELQDIVGSLVKGAEIEPAIDPSLVGGVVVRVGNMVYDASVKTQLQRLKMQLVS